VNKIEAMIKVLAGLSIVRVGQVIERGENKYLIAIFRGYKPNGTNDYFYKTFHGPKKEAEKSSKKGVK
jgi:hypothetical protein